MKIVKKSTENYPFYNHDKLLYVAWACFRNAVVLTPVLQKAEKCRFCQEIGGCYKGTKILKNSVPIRSIPFKCIFVRLEKALMRGKK